MSRNKRAVVASVAVGGLVALAFAPGEAASPVSTAKKLAPNGVEHIHPAGFSSENPATETRPVLAPETGSFIADSNSVSDQVKYAETAAKLPVSLANKNFVNLGPYGLDMPPGYSQSVEKFARVAGMGATAAVDPRDKSGNTLIIGTMGGAWRTHDGGTRWFNLTDNKTLRSAVGAVAYDKNHPGDIYIGTGIGLSTLSGDSQGTGMYVSHDDGKSFHRPLKNVLGYGVNAILPTSTGVLVGTTHGLYVSTDRGASFREILLKSNATHTAHQVGAYANWISSIVANPTQGRTVTVAIGAAYGKRKLTDGSYVSVGNGLYRSTNGVKGPFTFMPGTNGLSNATSSTDPIGRISLAYGSTAGQTPALWALVADAGLLNAKQPAGLDIIASTTGKSLNVTNTLLNGLYRSNDDGATWTLKANPTSLLPAPNSTVSTIGALGYGPGVQAFYNNWVVADPNVPDKVFFGLEEVYQTVANAGPTPGLAATEVIQRYADACGFLTYFQNVTSGVSCPNVLPVYGGGQSTHPDQHVGIAVATPNGTRLYTGNDGGFFRQDAHTVNGMANTFDNSSWTAMNTVATTQPYHVARKPDGEIVFGFQDNGGGFFKPGGPAITTSGGDGVLAIATHDPNVFYTSSQGAAFYVTVDHGHTIKEMQPNLNNANFTSPIVMDPTDENHLVAAATDVAETTLGPNTVTLFDTFATGTIIKTDWKSVYDAGNSPTINKGNPVPWNSQAIAVRGASIYSAVCGLCRNSLGDPTLIRTTVVTNVKAGCKAAKASSACWHVAKGKGLPHVAIQGIVIDPQNLRTIYVVLNENSLVGLNQKIVGSARVMVSKDAGESFSDITGNLPRSNMRSIVIRDGSLIVGGDNGVFTAKVGSTKWARLAGGLPQTRVYDTSLDSTGRYLTIAVYGRGVWQLDFGKAAKHSSSGPGMTGEPTPTARSAWHVITTVHALATWALLLLVALVAVRAIRKWRAPVLRPTFG